jgi:hypothetical protein
MSEPPNRGGRRFLVDGMLQKMHGRCETQRKSFNPERISFRLVAVIPTDPVHRTSIVAFEVIGMSCQRDKRPHFRAPTRNDAVDAASATSSRCGDDLFN